MTKKRKYQFVGKIDEIAGGKLYFENPTKSPLDHFDAEHYEPGDELYKTFIDSNVPTYKTNPKCPECRGRLFRGDEKMICTHCCRKYDLELLPEDRPENQGESFYPPRE